MHQLRSRITSGFSSPYFIGYVVMNDGRWPTCGERCRLKKCELPLSREREADVLRVDKGNDRRGTGNVRVKVPALVEARGNEGLD